MTRFAALTCVFLLGCGSGDSGAGPSGPAAPADAGDGCAEGLRRESDGTCVPRVFAGECPAGTRPALGQDECQAVGWQECPDGFERDQSGWGCAAVLPPAACSGATREDIGQTECVSIGDCAASFPPAGTKLFVSAAGPVDATHFNRISDAIAAAKTGDIIAVDDGVYGEAITLTKSITIAGRCASRVKLDGKSTATEPAIVAGANQATVRGVSIVGWDTGADVEQGSIVFEDVLFERNADLGITILDGAKVKLVRSAIRETFPRESVSGIGVQAIFGASIEIVDSVLAKNEGGGALVGEEGSSILVDRSVFRDNESGSDGLFGTGINITKSATGKVTRSAFLENRRAGLRAGPKTKLEIEDTVVRGTRTEEASQSPGHAFFALEGSLVTVKRFAASKTEGPAMTVLGGGVVKVEQATLHSMVGDFEGDLGCGAYAFEKGRIELTDTAIVDAGAMGVEAFDAGTSVTLDRCLIASTRPSLRTTMGAGVVLGFKAAATITDTSIIANRHSGIYLFEGSAIDIAGVLVRGTQKELFEDRLGHGMLVQDAPRVTIERTLFDGNVGIGVALASSPALIRSSVIRANAVGIHVEGSELRETSEAAEISSGEVIVSTDTTFIDNLTKIGSGVLALPEPPATKKP